MCGQEGTIALSEKSRSFGKSIKMLKKKEERQAVEKMKFAIIGAGRAGRSLARALQAAGGEFVAVAGGTAAEPFAEKCGAAFCATAAVAAALADVALLAVPDRAMETLAAELAAADLPPDLVVLHICGSQSAAALAALREKNISIGSLHPLQSFTEDTEAGCRHLRNIYFAVDGDAPAVKMARQLIDLLGGKMLIVPGEKRAIYHAAACMASNYLVAVLHAAAELMEGCGIAETEALHALQPIVEGTVRNIMEQGTTKALTGPLMRGDSLTVERHLAALDDFALPEAELYRAIGRYTVANLAKNSLLSEVQVKELQLVLENKAR